MTFVYQWWLVSEMYGDNGKWDWKLEECREKYIYIYIIYTPNLGSRIPFPGREREQGRFRGSTEGAKRRSEGAMSEHGGALGEQRGSTWQCRGAAGIVG